MAIRKISQLPNYNSNSFLNNEQNYPEIFKINNKYKNSFFEISFCKNPIPSDNLIGGEYVSQKISYNQLYNDIVDNIYNHDSILSGNKIFKNNVSCEEKLTYLSTDLSQNKEVVNVECLNNVLINFFNKIKSKLGRNLGDIFTTIQKIDNGSNGIYLCDGTEYNLNLFNDLSILLENQKIQYIDCSNNQEVWNSENNFGLIRKNGSKIKVPKLNDIFIESNISIENIGKIRNAALPKINIQSGGSGKGTFPMDANLYERWLYTDSENNPHKPGSLKADGPFGPYQNVNPKPPKKPDRSLVTGYGSQGWRWPNFYNITIDNTIDVIYPDNSIYSDNCDTVQPYSVLYPTYIQLKYPDFL